MLELVGLLRDGQSDPKGLDTFADGDVRGIGEASSDGRIASRTLSTNGTGFGAGTNLDVFEVPTRAWEVPVAVDLTRADSESNVVEFRSGVASAIVEETLVIIQPSGDLPLDDLAAL